MNLLGYDAFIFDLDGTLIDSERYHARAFSDAVFEQSGYQLTSDEQAEFFGKHSAWFAGELNVRHGLALKPERVLERKRERVREIFKAKPFSGACEFLEFWSGKKPMALATNSPLDFVQPALEEADLFHYFDHITTASEVNQRKPAPEMIERTLHKLGTDPLNTLVFEDQWIGIQAARAAGAQVITIDNGQSIEFPEEIAMYSWSELLRWSRNS